MLQNQIMEELKLIHEEKLAEIYDLIHYFRLGLKQETHTVTINKERPIGLAKEYFQVPSSFFEPLPDELLDAFDGR